MSDTPTFATDVTFGFTTIDRRETAFEAVRTLRRSFPDNHLIVVDQNEPDAEARAFYEEQKVDVRFVEYDIGLSAARNLMFADCPTRYFFMLDDDVVEIPTKEMEKSYALIRDDDRVLVVGGRYAKIVRGKDGSETRRINPPFNYFLHRQPEAKFAMFFDPGIVPMVPEPTYDRDASYRISDIVENFALFDAEKYRELGLTWDDEIKIVAEHTDFYLQVAKVTGEKGAEALIVSNPRLVAFDIDAHTSENMEDYRKKRYRHSFRQLYSDKWDINAEMHIGKWMNVYFPGGHKAVKWDELDEYGKKQRGLFKKAGLENIQRFGNYSVGDKRVSFIATTVDRYDAIQSLSLSIRARYGMAVDIVLGIQAEKLPDGFQRFVDAVGAKLVMLDYDIGLSAARNRMVETLDTEYFVLCDDDFVIDDQYSMGNALRLMDEDPNVAGVGGYYRDVIYDPSMRLKSTMDRHFTFQAFYEEKTGTLVRAPFYHQPFHECYDKERHALAADILQNIAVFRTKDFAMDKLHWDERMKITGEHLDFYVKNMREDRRLFLFDPGFSVLHNRVQNFAYRAKRSRTDGINLFFEKWNVQYEIDTERGIRSVLNGKPQWRSIG